jgi:RNA polymerase sigma factor (sigma-70 family)
MKAQPAAAETDRDLADAVLALGDEQAFRELYRRHTPRLLGFVSRLLAGTDSEAEDVVQETWIRACEGLERFRWQSTFSTWLLGIGLNLVRDQLRRHGRRSRMVPMESLPDRPAARASHEQRIDLERAIRALPDDYRLALVLHDVEGMKHHEIAGRLGIPVGTTKSQLFRARRMIRDTLSKSTEYDHE